MWQDDALCVDEVNAELWFPKSDTPEYLIDTAKYLCNICPVKKSCAALTLGNGTKPQYGIWAGELRGYSDDIT